jgi:sugar lactone lactonase YvrE
MFNVAIQRCLALVAGALFAWPVVSLAGCSGSGGAEHAIPSAGNPQLRQAQAAAVATGVAEVQVRAPNGTPIPLNVPIGLVEDGRGNLYVGNAASSQILIYSSKNVQLTSQTITDGVSAPAGLAFDKHGNLYVVNVKTHLVTVYDPSHKRINGKGLHTIRGNFIPSGIRIDPAGNAWVASRDNSNYTIGVVQVFNPAGKVIHTITHQLEYPVGLVFVNNDVWVCDSTTPSGNALTVFDSKGVYLKTVSTPNFTPTYAAKDAKGDIYVTNGLSADIAQLDSTGKVLRTTNNKGLDLPYGIAFNPAGDFYVANVGNNTITEYKADGSLIRTIH